MDITHLVVNGCSWTYCYGLDDQKSQGWPALVAKELGIPVVNIAFPGSGNDSINRRNYEYVYENLPTQSKPLFLIFWTQSWRREAWYNTGAAGYRGVHPAANNDEHEKALVEHWNEEDFVRRALLHKLSSINLFKTYNIPFLTADFAREDISIVDTAIDMKKALDNEKCHLVRDDISLGIINSYPKLPCKHDGIEAQKETAKWWIKQIHDNFSPIGAIKGDFLSLDKYIIQKSNHYMAWK